MDIWEKLYNEAKVLYNPHEVSPFIYAERAAAFNTYQQSKQTKIKRIIAFRDEAPSGVGGMPCGACREFLMQLNIKNGDTEIMVDYATRETITLNELMPNWWGATRA